MEREFNMFIQLMSILGIASSLAANPLFEHETYTVTPSKEEHAKGLLKSPESMKNLLKMQHTSFTALEESVVIPKMMDISSFVSLPENQGQCGSCWDFSLTKALRSEFMIAGKDPGTLEFNFLLNNCGQGPHMNGCSGGFFDAALSFEKGAGPGLNALNPYVARAGSCKYLPVQASSIGYTMLGTASGGPTFKDLAMAIAQKHMISVDVAAASGNWERYAGGIYNGCSGTARELDHMVTLVGYSCASSVDKDGNCVFDSAGRAINRDELLLVENSWGENWGAKAGNGHGGYMWTSMYGINGAKCNAIANDALIFTIASTPPIPKPTPSPTPLPPCKP